MLTACRVKTVRNLCLELRSPVDFLPDNMRLNTAGAIDRLRFVRRMQRLGFSLEEIRQLTGIRADKAHACAAVRQFLKTKLTEVTAKIRELQQLRSDLKADLRKCNRVLKGQKGKACGCPVLEEADE